jgi:hypothetical protein
MQVKKILTNAGTHGFNQLGLNMLISRLGREYVKDSSAAALGRYTDELNNFVTKFAPVMKNDMELIRKLEGGKAC